MTEITDPTFYRTPGDAIAAGPEALGRIYVRSTSGVLIQMSAFARFDAGSTPLSINHQGQFPSSTISFNLTPGNSLGNAVTQIANAEREINNEINKMMSASTNRSMTPILRSSRPERL